MPTLFEAQWTFVIGQFVCLMGITMAFALLAYGEQDQATVRMTKLLFLVGMFSSIVFLALLTLYLYCTTC